MKTSYLDSGNSAAHTLVMQKRSSKQPRDINQLAKGIVDLATGNPITEDTSPITEKNPAAVALGRLGGLKGGKARAEKLSAKKRKQIAEKAAKTRWENQKGKSV
jgi:hypothetical protein